MTEREITSVTVLGKGWYGRQYCWRRDKAEFSGLRLNNLNLSPLKVLPPSPISLKMC